MFWTVSVGFVWSWQWLVVQHQRLVAGVHVQDPARVLAVERDEAAAVDDQVGLVVEHLGGRAHLDRDRARAAVEGDHAALGHRVTTACEVQLSGVPVPTTWSGETASATPAPAGTAARRPGCRAPAVAASRG